MKPKRVCVLLSAFSGTLEKEGRDQILDALASAFKEQAISASLEFLSGTDLRSGAERALQKVSRAELDAIIVGGGDGSISTVAGVLAGSGVPLGIIPLGTLNHFAKDLKIPLAVDEAVAIIASGDTRPVDLAEVNGRIFVNNSSLGIYPYLVLDRERRRRRQGLPKWLAMVFAGFRALQFFPLRRLRVLAEGWEEPCRSPCVFVGNNEYRLTGLAVGTREKLDAGQLCLYVAKPQRRAELLWIALRSVLGLLDARRDLRIILLTAVEISSRRTRLLVALDGEIELLHPPLRYQMRAGALRVFAPPIVDV